MSLLKVNNDFSFIIKCYNNNNKKPFKFIKQAVRKMKLNETLIFYCLCDVNIQCIWNMKRSKGLDSNYQIILFYILHYSGYAQ